MRTGSRYFGRLFRPFLWFTNNKHPCFFLILPSHWPNEEKVICAWISNENNHHSRPFFIITEKSIDPYFILIINSLSNFTQSTLWIRCREVKSALFGWNCSGTAHQWSSSTSTFKPRLVSSCVFRRVWSNVSFRAGCLWKNERPDVNAGLWLSSAAHTSARRQSAASDRIPPAKQTDPPATIVHN